MNKPTVHDIAKEAGVSLATVDRVLNARPGVREKTIAKVNAAVERLGYVRDTYAPNLARQRQYRFVFVLPEGPSQFTETLRAALQAALLLLGPATAKAGQQAVMARAVSSAPGITVPSLHRPRRQNAAAGGGQPCSALSPRIDKTESFSSRAS